LDEGSNPSDSTNQNLTFKVGFFILKEIVIEE